MIHETIIDFNWKRAFSNNFVMKIFIFVVKLQKHIQLLRAQ